MSRWLHAHCPGTSPSLRRNKRESVEHTNLNVFVHPVEVLRFLNYGDLGLFVLQVLFLLWRGGGVTGNPVPSKCLCASLVPLELGRAKGPDSATGCCKRPRARRAVRIGCFMLQAEFEPTTWKTSKIVTFCRMMDSNRSQSVQSGHHTHPRRKRFVACCVKYFPCYNAGV